MTIVFIIVFIIIMPLMLMYVLETHVLDLPIEKYPRACVTCLSSFVHANTHTHTHTLQV